MRVMTVLVVLVAFVCLSGSAWAKEEKLVDSMKRDYYLYTPDKIDENKTYWLVVGVHGFRGNGKGAAGLSKWLALYDNVIVVGPTFPSTGPFYQQLGGASAKQLKNLHKALSKKYNLHKKMFLYGFSGGSQFVHRYTMKYPKDVVGCSSHSGGTWGKPNKKAKFVPFAISCGGKDTKVSIGAAGPRITMYRNFFYQMHKGKFFYKSRVRPNDAHRPGKWTGEVTKELFELSTTGLFPNQKEVVDKEVVRIEGLIEDGKKDAAKVAIQRLHSLKIPKLKYESKAVDDPEFKKPHLVNKYGWTSNKKSVKVMASRAKGYLAELRKELLVKLNPKAAGESKKHHH